MKLKLLTGIRVIIAVLLGLSVLTGCGSNSETDILMSGVPSAGLDLSGVVTNPDKQTLENIRVIVNTSAPMLIVDTMYTKKDGMYACEYAIFPDMKYVDIIVEDTTGIYHRDSVRVTDIKYVDDKEGGWDNGKVTIHQDFQLKK